MHKKHLYCRGAVANEIGPELRALVDEGMLEIKYNYSDNGRMINLDHIASITTKVRLSSGKEFEPIFELIKYDSDDSVSQYCTLRCLITGRTYTSPLLRKTSLMYNHANVCGDLSQGETLEFIPYRQTFDSDIIAVLGSLTIEDVAEYENILDLLEAAARKDNDMPAIIEEGMEKIAVSREEYIQGFAKRMKKH